MSVQERESYGKIIVVIVLFPSNGYNIKCVLFVCFAIGVVVSQGVVVCIFGIDIKQCCYFVLASNV